MLTVSGLYIYPIKSMGGMQVDAATVTPTGFQYDRRWMLVDTNHRFISQREVPQLALLQAAVQDQMINISHKQTGASFSFPVHMLQQEWIGVEIWEDTCTAQLVGAAADQWFAEQVSMPCRLVFMPDDTKRRVDPGYALHNEITSFSDGFPFLMIGQSSLDQLNSRLSDSLPMNRFRPNIVFTGGAPFEEDLLEHFTINGIHFSAVKPCARCVVTTTNQDTAEKGKEPLATLSTFRKKNNNIYFGQNLLHNENGELHVGDTIEVIKKREQSFLAGVV